MKLISRQVHGRYGRAWALLIVMALLGFGIGRSGLAEPSGGAQPPLGLEQAKTACRQSSALVGMALARLDAARLEEEESARTAAEIDESLVTSYEVAAMKILQPARATTERVLAEAALEALYVNLDLQVTLAYEGLLAAERFLELAKTGVARAEDQVNLARKLFTAGMVANKDVLDAEAKRAEALSGHASARKAQELARMSLLRLLGTSYTQLPPLDPGAAALFPQPVDPSQAAGLALERRYEALQTREYMAIAELNLELARTYPSGSYSSLIEDLLPPGFELPPEWAGEPSWETSNRYTIPKAEAQLREAQFGDRATREDLDFQVRSAYLDLDEAIQQAMLLEPAVIAAGEGLRLARLRYEAGLCTNLEMMAAALAVSAAETNYQHAVYNRHMASVRAVHAYSCGSKAIYPGAGASQGR